ncbi:MAG: DNA-binding protein WhiA [Oscillospiraceae bacterium]|jgi:DNA-binding protein WhiA|nr:DNA-binding protein WhiA [Oscillospiraceae bacterium]
MSFSSDVKSELCRLGVSKLCCARSEAYGVLLCCSTFTAREVRIVTESADFAARLPKLFQRSFGVAFDRLPEAEEGRKFVFQITGQDKLHTIVDLLGYEARQNLVLHINFAMLEEDCCRDAFLRGAFLAGGSVTDPVKRYHLELTTSHLQASRELSALLREMGYEPRQVVRSGYQVTYFKSSRQIEELLTRVGAPLSAMELMNAKAEKDLRNGVNRRVNCEAANVGKVVDAALEQLSAISRLYELGRVEDLPEKLKETIILRETYPELSLSELAAEFDPPISKSALSHRLRKLTELAQQ